MWTMEDTCTIPTLSQGLKVSFTKLVHKLNLKNQDSLTITIILIGHKVPTRCPHYAGSTVCTK